MIEKLEEMKNELQEFQTKYQKVFDSMMHERVTDPDSLLTEPITTNVTIAVQSIYIARIAMAGAIRDYKNAQEPKKITKKKLKTKINQKIYK